MFVSKCVIVEKSDKLFSSTERDVLIKFQAITEYTTVETSSFEFSEACITEKLLC